jgi:hypothetical protein
MCCLDEILDGEVSGLIILSSQLSIRIWGSMFHKQPSQKGYIGITEHETLLDHLDAHPNQSCHGRLWIIEPSC